MPISYLEPLEGNVGDIKPVKIRMVRKTSLEPLWDKLVRQYHYLGHHKMPGANLKYLAFSNDLPIAALGFRSASLRLKPRDCFIGWSKEQRSENLLKLANNNRFLILPWVRVKNLGSYLLSHIICNLLEDWYLFYSQKLLLLETFVDPCFYRGTVYKAAGWIHVGSTLGFTKKGSSYRYHGHPKEVYLYPLKQDFRDIIGCTQHPFKRPNPTLVYPERKIKMMLTCKDWDPNLAASLNISPQEVCVLGQKLYDFHQQFISCFRREEQRAISLTYLKGLASDLEAKSAEPIALRYLGEKAVRNTQHFLTTGIWDEEKLKAKHQTELAQKISCENGMDTKGYMCCLCERGSR